MAVNIARGWPFDGAINDVFPAAAGQNIIEGMACFLNASGELERAVGAQREFAWCAYDAQAAYDVQASQNKIPVTLYGTIQTTEFVTGVAYAPGTELQISTVGGQEGLILPHAGGTAPTYGWVTRGLVTFEGTTYLEFIKVIPNGSSQ